MKSLLRKYLFAAVICIAALFAVSGCDLNEESIMDDYRLSHSAITLNLTDEKMGAVMVIDDSYSAKPYTQAWFSSDSNVAIVYNGIVSAVGPGQAVITVSVTVEGYEPFEMSCLVTVSSTVEDVVLESIALTKNKLILGVGASEKIQCVPTPSNPTYMPEIIWMSDAPAVAEVTDGQITALSEGTAKITAFTEDGSIFADCVVTVKDTEDSIYVFKLTRTSRERLVGQSYQFKWAYVLTDGTFVQESTDPIVTQKGTEYIVEFESSDPDVVTVNEKGYMKAISAGTAVITASVQDELSVHTFDCVVTVTERTTDPEVINAAKLELSKYDLDMKVGDSDVTIKATVTPSNTTQTISWQSYNTDVATVDNGVIHAVAKGEATIKCTIGTLVKAVNVTVLAAGEDASSVQLDKSSVSLFVNGTETLTATLNPKTTTDIVRWTTSDAEVATVSADGVVTAKGSGTATITATATSGVTAECVVTVAEGTTANVTLSKTLLYLNVGGSDKLTKNVTPSKVESDLTWEFSSDDTGVATVDSDGNVSAVSAGEVIIRLKGYEALEGGSRREVCSASCNVVVSAE